MLGLNDHVPNQHILLAKEMAMKPKHQKRLFELTKQLRESIKRANTAIDAGIAAIGAHGTDSLCIV